MTNGASDRDKVHQALVKWMSMPSTRPVIRVLEGRRPAYEQPSYFKEEPRLVIGLQGSGRYITVENGHEMMFDLVPGQVLYLAPCTWSCPLPEVAYRSLAITLRPNFTRVTIHSRQAMRTDGTIPWHYVAQWQCSAGLGERGDHLLAVLADSTPSRLGERIYNLTTEILISEVAGLVESQPASDRTNEVTMWHSLCDYISIHWADSSLSRKTIAEFFHLHPNHLSRFFHRHTDQNFRGYLNEIRLKRSLQFLGDFRYNITDVASLCGFTDLQYFIRCFRRRFGFTPGEYRKKRG